jgi:hypothetical protein
VLAAAAVAVVDGSSAADGMYWLVGALGVVLVMLVAAAGLYGSLFTGLPVGALEAAAYRSAGVVEIGVVVMLAAAESGSLGAVALVPLGIAVDVVAVDMYGSAVVALA